MHPCHEGRRASGGSIALRWQESPLGYATGQFGKNHFGDLNRYLPTVHGFDEFFGNLYHLNAEQDPEDPDYPDPREFPQFKARFGPRGVLHAWATPEDDSTEEPRWGRVGRQRIQDTGPLTIERMRTCDDEFVSAAKDWIKRQHSAGKPWFCWLEARSALTRPTSRRRTPKRALHARVMVRKPSSASARMRSWRTGMGCWSPFASRRRTEPPNATQALLMLVENSVHSGPITVGADKGYDAREFVEQCRHYGITPHVAQNTSRKSAIDERTTCHAGYTVSQRIRKRVEEIFGWAKTVGGFRKTRFKGIQRTQLAAYFVGAAYNLVRMARLLAAPA